MAASLEPDTRGRFQLRRFEWSAPDRLLVAGAFDGVTPPPEAPALVLHGDDREYQLPGTLDGDGAGDWTASFVWREPPAAFHRADLQLGGGLAVALPPPGRLDGQPVLQVRGDAGDSASQPDAGDERLAAVPSSQDREGRGLVDVVRAEAAVLGAREALRAEEARRRQLEQELLRARADVDAERERHAADAERFQQGLAHVQAVGEQALTVADAEIGQLRARVGALEADAAAAEQLRGEHELARQEADELRAALQDAGAQGDAARARLAENMQELEQARAETARLRTQLDAIRSALGDLT